MIRGFVFRARRVGDRVLRELHEPERFRVLLAKERARTDRTGDPFSLLTFTIRDPETAPATLRRLAMVLKWRVRLTDEAGWLDHERVAVILPHTPAAGAWQVADDVCEAFPSDIFAPLCKVYVYPNDACRWTGDAHDDHSAHRPKRPAVGAKNRLSHEHETGPRPIEAMERLFCRRLPRWKRLIDVAVAAASLVLLSPLLAVVALSVRLSGPGPVLFWQWRTGLGGRPFRMCKFRSMVCDAEQRKRDLLARNEQDGPAFKLRNDPRVTRVGRFLRASSLDELPQLWNVLRGEMSLVGPRPLPVGEQDASQPWHRRRLDVTPGLTCVWQVRGRSAVSFNDWMRMDLQYLAASSLGQDLRLLLQTLPALVLRRGV